MITITLRDLYQNLMLAALNISKSLKLSNTFKINTTLKLKERLINLILSNHDSYLHAICLSNRCHRLNGILKSETKL